MGTFLVAAIQDKALPANGISDPLPPGDTRIWEALKASLGAIRYRPRTLVYIGTESTSISIPSFDKLSRWLGFRGLHIVEAVRETSGLSLQIRPQGREGRPLETLLRELIAPPAGEDKALDIWVADEYLFEANDAVASAIHTLLSLGGRSGIFDVEREEARIVGTGDPLGWPRKVRASGSLKEAFQEAFASAQWSTLRENYRITERRPRAEPESRDIRDPLSSGLHSPDSAASVRALEAFGAPATFVVGLPETKSPHAHAVALRRQLNSYASFMDRSVALVQWRDPAPPLLTIDHMGRLPVNQRVLSRSAGPTWELYIVGPWDSRNALMERRVEDWAAKDGRDAVTHGELLDGEQDLLLYYTRTIAREAGWSVNVADAKQLIFTNRERTVAHRSWFFWSSLPREQLLASAQAVGVPLLALGQSAETGRCDFVKPTGEGAESIKISLIHAEPNSIRDVVWAYPEVKAPTYGFDKAAVYPDQFLLKVTKRRRVESEWARESLAFQSGDRMRGLVARRMEANSIPSVRWSSGGRIWAEAMASRRGLIDVDARAMGASVADAAIRSVLAQGGDVRGGVAGLWATHPIQGPLAWILDADRDAEVRRDWGSFMMGLEAAVAYFRHFNIEMTSIIPNGPSFQGARPEIVARLRTAMLDKVAPISPGFRMVGEVLYAIGPRPAFVDAGSRVLDHVRVVSNHAFKLVPHVQEEVYRIVTDLMTRGKITCLRPVGEGGVVQALGEMALWGGLGAQIRPNLPVIELFSGSPGRFVVGVLPSEAKAVETSVRSEWLTVLGTTGGEKIMGLPLTQYYEERQNELLDEEPLE